MLIEIENRSRFLRILLFSVSKWQDNIKMDIKEIGYGVEWINLAQDRGQLRTP
jgi:hypothetical protein